MAEHLHRVQHLDAATHRLEEQAAELSLKRNTLRQEEITEEIEVILLSTEALA
jgi:F-type H+-transporting ATPase subunit gamma